MYKKNYLEDINKSIFPERTKHISEGKAGDIVIYRGGKDISTDRQVTSIHFTIGKEYVLSQDYSFSENSIAYFVNHLSNFGEKGHLSIVADDTGTSNGWSAALFELI